jgi:hypothetical protein
MTRLFEFIERPRTNLTGRAATLCGAATTESSAATISESIGNLDGGDRARVPWSVAEEME